MFDRQRSSKPQLQRKVASKAREELEVDAAEKEARLAELRSTMSKEKLEIDKLMSQRGPTLWTSSSEIRASPGTRQANPTKSLAAKAKGGVLTEVSPVKQTTQLPVRREGSSATKGAQPKMPKPGPVMEAQAEAAKESTSYRPSPTRRLSNAASGKATGPINSNQLAMRLLPQKGPNLKQAVPASTPLQRSSSGRAVPCSPGSGSGRAGGGTSTSTAAVAGSASKSSNGMSGIGGTSYISGGVAGASGGLSNVISGSRDGIAAQTDGGRYDNSGHSIGGGSSSGMAASGQDAAKPVATDAPRSAVKAFKGPSLLDGDFNEDDSHASFADALSCWRGKGSVTAPTQAGPEAAPGICTQAGGGVMAKAPAAMSSPQQTYFERLLMNRASQEAAAAVAGKPVRCFADDKEAALQSERAEAHCV